MFKEEISYWIDNDGLIGNKKKPEKWSTGNALLETGFGILLARELGYFDIANKLEQAILSCKSDNGLFNKNPGRTDEITFDCLIGAASSSQQAANIICEFGNKNLWIMSNTGKIYWTSLSRPQYIAFYKIAAGREPNLLELSLLIGSLLISPNTPSGKRLEYLVLKTCKSYNVIFKMLYKRFINKNKSIKEIHAEYYGNKDHPYCNYGE